MKDDKRDNLQRLLDYNLGLDGGASRRETEKLLGEDAELSKLNEALKGSLAPLGSWQDEEPPAGLADPSSATHVKPPPCGALWSAMPCVSGEGPITGRDCSTWC